MPWATSCPSLVWPRGCWQWSDCGKQGQASPCAVAIPSTSHHVQRWALELNLAMLLGVGPAVFLETHALVFCFCAVTGQVIKMHGKDGKAVNKLWAAPGKCEWTEQYWGGPWEVTWGAHRSLYEPGCLRDAAPLSASTTMPAALNPSSCPSFCMDLGSRICSPSSCWADTGDTLGPRGLTPVIGVNRRKNPVTAESASQLLGLTQTAVLWGQGHSHTALPALSLPLLTCFLGT